MAALIIFLVAASLFWILPTYIAVQQGNSKGRRGQGWTFGLLLGWIGVIVMLMLPRRTPTAI
jgi:hypothetical protein